MSVSSEFDSSQIGPGDTPLSPRARRGWFLLFAAVGVLIVGIAVARFAVTASATSEQTRASHAGLVYAENTMGWLQGPSIRSAHEVRLGQIQSALVAYVSVPTRQDVNVPDLIRRYGSKRQVVLVVLTGTYNSLPPDEGVDVHGDVIEVVDARTNRVLLLMD
jgi:hypothetical protein